MVQLHLLVSQGVLFSRWAPDLMLGMGYPLFQFVPPLPYVGALLLALLPGLDLLAGLKALVVLALGVLGLGVYGWVRAYLDRTSAAVAAVLAIFAPFYLRELFVQGNVPQLVAYACVPWCLRGVEDLLKGRRRAIVWMAVPVAAAIASHLAVGLIAVLSTLILAGTRVAWLQGPRRQPAAMVLVAVLLGLGLSAWVWLPAVEGTANVWIRTPLTTRRHFEESFVPRSDLMARSRPADPQAVNPPRPFNLGTAPLVLAAVGVVGAARAGRRGRSVVTGALPIALVGVFLATPSSRPLWEQVGLLHFLEFPSRFVGLAAIGMAALGGAGAAAILRAVPGRYLKLGAACGLVLGSTLPEMSWTTSLEPNLHPGPATRASLERFERETGALGMTSYGEYLPLTVTLQREELPSAWAAETRKGAVQRRSLGYWNGWRLSRGWELTVGQAGWVLLPHLFYPGWTAEVDGESAQLTPSEGTGLSQVWMNAGDHTVVVTDSGSGASGWGALLSISGLAAASVIWVRAGRRRAGVAGLERPSEEPPSSVVTGIAGAVPLTLVLLLAARVIWADQWWTWFGYPADRVGVPPVAEPLEVRLGRDLELAGISLDGNTVGRGGVLRVDMAWRLRLRAEADYRTFVHLSPASEPHQPLAVSDHRHPGLDYPFTRWEPGRYILDSHELIIPSWVPTVPLELRVGVYDPATGERLGKAEAGYGPFPDLIDLGTVWVVPAEGEEPATDLEPPAVFAGDIALEGHDLSVLGGTEVHLTLFWRALETPERDWSVFVHLVDPNGDRLAQADGYPADGSSPTGRWFEDLRVADPRTIVVESGVPSGAYLLIGLYSLETGERASASIGEAALLESAVRIDLSR